MIFNLILFRKKPEEDEEELDDEELYDEIDEEEIETDSYEMAEEMPVVDTELVSKEAEKVSDSVKTVEEDFEFIDLE